MTTDIQLSGATAAPTLSDEAFLGLFLRSQDAEETRRAYDQAIRDFGRFLGQRQQGEAPTSAEVVGGLRLLTREQANTLVAGYRTHLMEAGRKPNTINIRLSTLRELFKHAHRFGLIDWKDLDVDSVEVKNYRDTRGPGRDGFMRILGAVQGNEPVQVRDRAILKLMFARAMRRFQVAGLDVEDLDVANRRLSIRDKGFGDQKSPISLPQPVVQAIQDWIAVRPECAEGERHPLFCNLNEGAKRGRLATMGIYKMVKKYGKKVGIKAWPHALRHASITDALDRGFSVRDVQQLSRHANLNTLMKYDDNRKDRAGAIADSLSEGL